MREYATPGGAATFSCTGSTVALVSASPANGYQLSVVTNGPDVATVDFANQQSRDDLTVHCVGGVPETEQANGSPGGAGGGQSGGPYSSPSSTTSPSTTSSSTTSPSTTSPSASSSSTTSPSR